MFINKHAKTTELSDIGTVRALARRRSVRAWGVLFLGLATVTWAAANAGGAPPPRGGAGSYSGVYVGGDYGGYHSGYNGVYIGGRGTGYPHYTGVYVGGYPGSRPLPTEQAPGATGMYGYYPEPTQGTPVPPPSGVVLPRPPRTAIAFIDLHVPADATVWIDGVKTSQTGPERHFVSPPLEPDSKYYYQVREQWNENGRKVEKTRKVQVQAGGHLSVDLRPGDGKQP